MIMIANFVGFIMYQLSKDYEKLYQLICAKKRVVAFVDYQFRGNNSRVMRDVCLVERRKDNSIVGFVRGIGYFEVYDWQTPCLDEKECFIVDCKHVNLEFIPQSTIPIPAVVGDITKHSFCDVDVEIEQHENDYSVGFKIEYKCHVTIPNEFAYMFLTKNDVIALAKHLKVTASDLQRGEQK